MVEEFDDITERGVKNFGHSFNPPPLKKWIFFSFRSYTLTGNEWLRSELLTTLKNCRDSYIKYAVWKIIPVLCAEFKTSHPTISEIKGGSIFFQSLTVNVKPSREECLVAVLIEFRNLRK
jgi:hypothetical protein